MTTRDQTQKNYDRLSRWYDRFAGSEKMFTDLGLQMLAVKEGERVLEIGFGTGHALAALAQQTGDSGLAAGVELSPGMIAAARKGEVVCLSPVRVGTHSLAGNAGLPPDCCARVVGTGRIRFARCSNQADVGAASRCCVGAVPDQAVFR